MVHEGIQGREKIPPNQGAEGPVHEGSELLLIAGCAPMGGSFGRRGGRSVLGIGVGGGGGSSALGRGFRERKGHRVLGSEVLDRVVRGLLALEQSRGVIDRPKARFALPRPSLAGHGFCSDGFHRAIVRNLFVHEIEVLKGERDVFD